MALDDKVAAAMAASLGVDLVDDDKGDAADTATQDTAQDTADTKTKSDTADDSAGKPADDGKTDSAADGSDKTDDTSSGDQTKDADVGSDQADDTKTLPDTSSSESGADQGKDFESLLAERSGGRFKSIADIDKALEDAPASAFANEQIAKLNDYVKAGGRLEDYVRTQTVDYSKMTPEQLVFEKMKLDDPELTADEISLLLEEDYGVSKDASEREKKIAAAKLKKASREALLALQEHKAKWATPEQADTADAAKAQELWEKQLESAVKAVDNIPIKLNQTDEFAFKIEEDVKQKMRQDFRDVRNFFKKYIKEDGTEDTQQFVKDMIKLQYFDTIVRAAAAANKNKGKKEVIDDLKNPDFTGTNKGGSDDGGAKTIRDQALREFMKHN